MPPPSQLSFAFESREQESFPSKPWLNVLEILIKIVTETERWCNFDWGCHKRKMKWFWRGKGFRSNFKKEVKGLLWWHLTIRRQGHPGFLRTNSCYVLISIINTLRKCDYLEAFHNARLTNDSTVAESSPKKLKFVYGFFIQWICFVVVNELRREGVEFLVTLLLGAVQKWWHIEFKKYESILGSCLELFNELSWNRELFT